MGYCPICKNTTPMEYELHRCPISPDELVDWLQKQSPECSYDFEWIIAAILEKYEVRRK